MTPAGRPGKGLLRSLTIRLPEQQMEYLLSRAEASGVGLGEVLRRLIDEERERRPVARPKGE